MKKKKAFQSLILSIACLFVLWACSPNNSQETETLPYYQDAYFTPHWLHAGDQTLDTFHRISPFQLINQDGDTITENHFAGKIYVADFFFTTCPGICPKMTANMSSLQEAFLDAEDVLLLSHSVTPETDTVPMLRQYAEAKGIISGKWHLTTGDQREIYKLGRQDYFVEEDLGTEKDLDEFLHTENFVLIDKNRHIRGIYNGLNKASVRQLIADIRLLQTES
ncbi:MAG: SCO family protein [Bacteroidota bacterium]